MDMESLCIACRSRPSGIDGHADLRVQTLGNDMLSFKCGNCGALWSRTEKRSGQQFAWAAMGERTAASPWIGVLVPSSSRTA